MITQQKQLTAYPSSSIVCSFFTGLKDVVASFTDDTYETVSGTNECLEPTEKHTITIARIGGPCHGEMTEQKKRTLDNHNCVRFGPARSRNHFFWDSVGVQSVQSGC